jgi:serine O-acetyltransferase
MPDPVAHALDRIFDHMHLVDHKLQQLDKALKEAGVVPPSQELPEIETIHLNSPPSPKDGNEG